MNSSFLRSSSILLLFFSCGAPAKGPITINRTLVVVNGDIVLESDVRNFMKHVKSPAFNELFGGLDKEALKSRQSVIQYLIEETIIDQQVDRLQLTATEQEINGQIKAITQRNGITPSQLKMRLKQLGTNMTEYRKAIKRQTERNNLVNREIRPNLEISEEQLRRYFVRNARKEAGQKQYEIAHIFIASGGKKRATEVWQTVSKTPSKFSAYAKELSDDEGTSNNGGKLGLFAYNTLSESFQKVIPKMKVGTVSKPIKGSGSAYHILKLLSVKRADLSTISPRRKRQLRNEMVAKELEKRFTMWIERKKGEAHIRWSKKPSP